MVARKRRRDVDSVDASDLTANELREVRLRWWRALREAQDQADRTGDRAAFLRWLAENPRPGPDRYTHLRKPGG